MTREEAIQLRTRQLAGDEIHPALLLAALERIKEPPPRRGGPYRIPVRKLTPEERERADGVLLFNLGRVLGRPLEVA